MRLPLRSLSCALLVTLVAIGCGSNAPGKPVVDAGAGTDPLEDLQRAFVDLRFGMFIHFGILTYTGNWADANLDITQFNPTMLDPGQWADAAVSAHMKFGVLTTRHDVVGLSVLGVGAGTGKLTIDGHRAIDVQLNAAFARALKASGRVAHLAFMSAAGADPTAAASGSGAAGMARYARVKGEAEEAVKESGPAVVSIFRPAMIIGSRHTPWLLAKVLPAFSFMVGSARSLMQRP